MVIWPRVAKNPLDARLVRNPMPHFSILNPRSLRTGIRKRTKSLAKKSLK
jgi:hypothetical protein